MIQFKDLDCTRFRKPNLDFSQIEERVIRLMGEYLKEGLSGEEAISRISQSPEFLNYSAQLETHYATISQQAELRVKEEATASKKKAAEAAAERQRQADAQAAATHESLDKKMEDTTASLEQRRNETVAQLQALQSQASAKTQAYNQSAGQFIKNIDEGLSGSLTQASLTQASLTRTSQAPNDPSSTENHKKIAEGIVEEFYHKLPSGANEKKSDGKPLVSALERYVLDRAEKNKVPIGDYFRNRDAQSELFEELYALRTQYNNLFKREGFCCRMKTAAEEAASQAKKAIIQTCKAAIIAAALAGGAYCAYKGAIEFEKRQHNKNLAEIAEQETMRGITQEDEGLIAYLGCDKRGTLFVGPITEANNPGSLVEHIVGDYDLVKAMWGKDGSCVYLHATESTEGIFRKDKILKYDLKKRKTTTLLDLSKCDDPKFEPAQMEQAWVINTRQGPRIGFSARISSHGHVHLNGNQPVEQPISYSIGEDGKRIRRETTVLPEDQTYCPSRRHHLDADIFGHGGEILIQDSKTGGGIVIGQGYAPKGFAPVYSPNAPAHKAKK